MNKICTRCGEEKDISCFRKMKYKENGYVLKMCKACECEKQKEYYKDPNNKEKRKITRRKMYEKNKEKEMEYQREYRNTHRDKINQRQRQYRELNKYKRYNGLSDEEIEIIRIDKERKATAKKEKEQEKIEKLKLEETKNNIINYFKNKERQDG